MAIITPPHQAEEPSWWSLSPHLIKRGAQLVVSSLPRGGTHLKKRRDCLVELINKMVRILQQIKNSVLLWVHIEWAVMNVILYGVYWIKYVRCLSKKIYHETGSICVKLCSQERDLDIRLVSVITGHLVTLALWHTLSYVTPVPPEWIGAQGHSGVEKVPITTVVLDCFSAV